MPSEEDLLGKKDDPAKEKSGAEKNATISPEEEEAFGIDDEAQGEGKSKKDGPVEGEPIPADKEKE
jgi:hypothetical protein